ncbi:MAG TPA: FAD-dependent oxidoreductase [Dehalococcoidia bacterium]|nr:FAD-dependent oxidoreductase [Dehalococcoidia bacterium]
MEPIKVLLVEDHPNLRRILRGFLEEDPATSLVGEAGTRQEALLQARQTSPDVVLVDISLPGGGGVEFTRALKAELPQTKVILLLEEENQEYQKACGDCGASGYLPKVETPFRLLPLVRAVNRGTTLGEEMEEKAPVADKPATGKRLRVVQADLDWFLDNVKCQAACPAHTDVPTYAALISQGRFEEAFEVNRRYNVFPSILGRICTRVCQSACRRAIVDDPVSICYLKRSAGDARGEIKPRPAEEASLNRKVAVVGAGPAGLTVAKDLADVGYQVTVFEALGVVGGMLRVGIPAYRLPRRLIDDAADELAALGVEIRLNTPIGRDVKLDDLTREYQAVVIAAGAHKPEKLGIPGEELEGVLHGVSFMRMVNLGQEISLGRSVAVIGLGHTAVDCARSAVRLGAQDVHILYRRTAAEAAAGEEEIAEAEEEGVTFHYLTSPLRVLGSDGERVSGLECQLNRLGDPDSGGRRRPVPVQDSEFVLPIDNLIPAVSQSPDLSFLPGEIGLEVSRWDRLVVDQETFMTSQAGIFAIGDFITGPRDVIHVIADGHRAAAAVDTYLRGPREVEQQADMEVVSPYRRDGSYLRVGRQRMPTLPTKERGSLDAEVELGYSPEEAIAEASRCLQCQINVMIDSEKCILCGGCVDVCPFNALSMVPLETLQIEEGLALDSIKGAALLLNEERCTRCGLCEARCPTRAISMVRMYRDERSRYYFREAAPQQVAAAAASGRRG